MLQFRRRLSSVLRRPCGVPVAAAPRPPRPPLVAIPRTRADKETNNCSPRRLAECALVAPMLVCTCACVRVCVRVIFILSPSRRGVHKERPNKTLALASASASASAMTLPG